MEIPPAEHESYCTAFCLFPLRAETGWEEGEGEGGRLLHSAQHLKQTEKVMLSDK